MLVTLFIAFYIIMHAIMVEALGNLFFIAMNLFFIARRPFSEINAKTGLRNWIELMSSELVAAVV